MREFSRRNLYDEVPLSNPTQAADGSAVDRSVSKGTTIRIPIAGINRSEAVRGLDTGRFDPG